MELIPKWSDDLYEVSRSEYSGFVRSVKPEIRDIREYGDSDGTIHIELWSKTHNIRLCGRISNPQTNDPERYYIWDYPEENEMQEWTPGRRIVLDTPQQVQAVFDAIKKAHGNA